jgi:hypothetical protein
MTLIEIFKSTYTPNSQDTLEESLQVLKTSGATQIECLKILISELNISLKEADHIILNSLAWRAEKQITENLRDKIFNEMSDLDEYGEPI